MREGLEGLLIGGQRLAERGAVVGPGAGLLAEGHGLVPHLPPQGMVRQAFHLLGHAVPDEGLQGLDDAGMESAPPLLEQRLIGHLLSEDVLEGVLVLGEEARLIEELGRLEVRETVMQRRLGPLGHGLQQRHGDFGADDGGGLQELFLLQRQAVDAGRQHGLHGRGELQGGEAHPALALQRALFHQRLSDFLKEEGIALRLGEDRLGQRGRDSLRREDRPHDLDTVLGRERRQGELGGIGFIEPRRLIARPIRGEYEDRRPGDTVNHSRQERFRSGVDPLQIFYGEDEGVLLAAVQDYLPQGLEGLALQRLRADAYQRLSPR